MFEFFTADAKNLRPPYLIPTVSNVIVALYSRYSKKNFLRCSGSLALATDFIVFDVVGLTGRDVVETRYPWYRSN